MVLSFCIFFSPANATDANQIVTIKPAVNPTAISTRTIKIKFRLLNNSSDGNPVKLTTARPKMKDITTRMGVGTPLIPNNGEDITNEPTRTVARKKRGNTVTILLRFNPGKVFTSFVKRSSSIINLMPIFGQK